MEKKKSLPDQKDKCCSHDEHSHQVADAGEHDHDHPHNRHAYWPALFALLLLILGLVFDHYAFHFFSGDVRLAWYVVAYLPVAYPVIKMAIKTIVIGDIFTEFLLMALATLGALALGEYPEAVTVLLFYTVGELFQEAAVNRAKGNIKALLDVRPLIATVLRNGEDLKVKAQEVEISETIQLKAGEKLPLDAELLSDMASFDTAALTGESKPKTFHKGDQVLAGMLNLNSVITLKVLRKYEDSALSKILALVQDATARKAKTELMIRKFAKVYTPIVFFLAVALVIVPYLFVQEYHFRDWLYRALVFLVISCPCALVISITLGYFGGIGAASANGILFKGANFLDLLTKVNTVVLDKTGTLTKGVFKVVDIQPEIEKDKFMEFLSAIESQSTHPIAKAIVAHHGKPQIVAAEVEEIAGHGLTALVDGQKIVAGNTKLLKKMRINYPAILEEEVETLVLMALNNQFAGYVKIADEVKPDAKAAVQALHANGVRKVMMLSGDKSAITQKIARELGIDEAHGDLLPEGKVSQLQRIKQQVNTTTAFVGDGINDAPVLAMADVGIAMGAMGSDVAIETANVVIQNDQPSKLVTAILIGKATKKVVYQNIGLAFAVKAIVLILGAGGLATMWEAVFADVGVAFLAILNAVRIQRMRF